MSWSFGPWYDAWIDAGGLHVVQVLGRLQLQVDVTHPTIDISTRNPMVSLVMKKLNCRCRTRSLPITISLILCFCWDRPLFVDHAPIPFCISTNSLFYGSQLLFCWFNFIFFLIKLQFVWVESLVSAVKFQTFIFLDMYPNVWWSNMVKSQMAA